MQVSLRQILFSIFFFILCGQATGQPRLVKKPVDYVNPFIGASTSTARAGVYHGLGKTFPGAATPFGMVQLSPNTITGGDNGSGYSYEHNSIEGFAFTQMSGVGWYGDLGNFLIMPATGDLKTIAGRPDQPANGYRSLFSKATENASAGYYSVMLDRYRIKAEATAAPHSGMLRFTFPANPRSRIQIDLARRVGGTSTKQSVRIVNDSAIEGWMECTPEGGGWGNGAGNARYTVYFYAECSKPLSKTGIWSADIPDSISRRLEDVESDGYQQRIAHAKVFEGARQMEGKHLGFYTEFSTTSNEEVILKAGISFVSIAGAKANLLAEIPGWNFDTVRAATRAQWNKALGSMTISGGTEEEKTVFYTALYHTMLDPRSFQDVDGSFPAGDGSTGKTSGYTRRTIFSGWDVFRSQMPLQTLIHPTIVRDMLASLTALAGEKKLGWLERWEFLDAYSGCMIGHPAIAVLADAVVKGIRDINIPEAYRLAVQSLQREGNGLQGYDTTGLSISRTLEYAYDDWCLSRVAGVLEKKEDAAHYNRRGQFYHSIFDSTWGWFRPKDGHGNWLPIPAEGRLQQGFGCIESNPYQQGWFVPHDVDGLASLLGGHKRSVLMLDSFFRAAPDNMMWNNAYNHANEPVHHAAFLFNRMGAPWLTQYWSREICRRAYHNSVEGLVGNEDVGQMSAWYVLAATGLHPVCPGDTRQEITSPVFDKITIRLDPHYATGKTFTIVALNNSPVNRYIQRAKLNGRAYTHCFIDFAQIISGGVLELVMGPDPNMTWGIR